ncbi:MAG: hypothetical protein HRU09_19125 [Oligoflexales bacterium]|nr:hypothetical protein [Oligoflexales bacterium]
MEEKLLRRSTRHELKCLLTGNSPLIYQKRIIPSATRDISKRGLGVLTFELLAIGEEAILHLKHIRYKIRLQVASSNIICKQRHVYSVGLSAKHSHDNLLDIFVHAGFLREKPECKQKDVDIGLRYQDIIEVVRNIHFRDYNILNSIGLHRLDKTHAGFQTRIKDIPVVVIVPKAKFKAGLSKLSEFDFLQYVSIVKLISNQWVKVWPTKKEMEFLAPTVWDGYIDVSNL